MKCLHLLLAAFDLTHWLREQLVNWEQQFIRLLSKQDVEPSAELITMSLALLDPGIQQWSCWHWQRRLQKVTHSESLSVNKSFTSAMNFIYHQGKEIIAAAKNTNVQKYWSVRAWHHTIGFCGLERSSRGFSLTDLKGLRLYDRLYTVCPLSALNVAFPIQLLHRPNTQNVLKGAQMFSAFTCKTGRSPQNQQYILFLRPVVLSISVWVVLVWEVWDNVSEQLNNICNIGLAFLDILLQKYNIL